MIHGPFTTLPIKIAKKSNISIFVDGACKKNKKGGAGLYIPLMESEIRESRSLENSTNNKAELEALIMAFEFVKVFSDPRVDNIIIYQDSKYVIDGFCTNLKKWLANDFKLYNGNDVKNKEEWLRLKKISEEADLAFSKERKKDIYIVWVKGHSDNAGNAIADRLAVNATLN